MRKFTTFITLFILLVSYTIQSSAQMPLNQGKQILNMTQDNWVAFRKFNGKQLLYFTHLESWRCHIADVSFKVNNAEKTMQWKLQPCDPNNPNAVTTDKPYISYPDNHIEQVEVILTFKDGVKTKPVVFKP